MPNDKLTEQSFDFDVHIINLIKRLKEQRENIMSNQIGRSGMSIGANIFLTITVLRRLDYESYNNNYIGIFPVRCN